MQIEEENKQLNEEKIVVHICGCVNKEGVIELNKNSRIADAIEMAGGLNNDADISQINLAYILEDGMKITIPNKNEKKENNNENSNVIVENNIKEVWGAWGNDSNIDVLIKGKEQVKDMLSSIGVKVYYFGTLTKEGNPRHPIQRQEKWDLSKKEYLEL